MVWFHTVETDLAGVRCSMTVRLLKQTRLLCSLIVIFLKQTWLECCAVWPHTVEADQASVSCSMTIILLKQTRSVCSAVWPSYCWSKPDQCRCAEQYGHHTVETDLAGLWCSITHTVEADYGFCRREFEFEGGLGQILRWYIGSQGSVLFLPSQNEHHKHWYVPIRQTYSCHVLSFPRLLFTHFVSMPVSVEFYEKTVSFLDHSAGGYSLR